jgi:hypothetical protein
MESEVFKFRNTILPPGGQMAQKQEPKKEMDVQEMVPRIITRHGGEKPHTVRDMLLIKIVKAKPGRKLMEALESVMPKLAEHAKKVHEGNPSKILLTFDSANQARQAVRILQKTGMVGKVSRKEQTLTLENSPPGKIAGDQGTHIKTEYK